MAYENSKALPTIDYVSIVVSLYKDRRAMVVGMSATIVGVLVAAIKTGSPILYGQAGAFALVMVLRYLDMAAFARTGLAPDDRAGAERWEVRATVIGVLVAFLYGLWCFTSLVFVGDDFAELVAISVTVAAMIGIVARNFGIDRLITLQSLALGTPLALGLMLDGDVYHVLLALLLVPMMVSFRFLAADVRAMLLNAVHDRVNASRLADQLDTALETMQHGLCMLDENGVIALVNQQAEMTFSGIAEGSWVGRTIEDLLSEAIDKRALPSATAERLMAMIAERAGGKVVLKLSGDFYCEVSVSSRDDRTVLLFENVTARIKAQERINFMARYDSLTSLPNRASFTERVEADLGLRRRKSEPEAAVLMIIDLDDFKHVNDTLGHLAGDRVLVEAANRIQTVMHRESELARLGGDEFVIYRSRGTGHGSAAAEASAILKAMSQPFDVVGERVDLRASIGFVNHLAQDATLDDLTTRADLALYRAKARGKGQWLEFVEEMDGEFRYRQRLKADLYDAIAGNQLRLVYQPFVELATGRVAGCEALARWTHPELGPIPPMTFIALAEEIGLVSEITGWVLETATAQAMAWPDPMSISVNVSGRDLRSDVLTAQIAKALSKSGLAPHRLEIEVTETALIEEREVAAQRLGALAARGIGIALDDFGTGYSSLSYLHEMPFTKLKIDRSFIADIETNPRSLRLMANVARLGKDLDLVITVEGVETKAQLAMIETRTEIDQVQGYYFGKPMSAPEIAAFIEKMTGKSRRRHLKLAHGAAPASD